MAELSTSTMINGPFGSDIVPVRDLDAPIGAGNTADIVLDTKVPINDESFRGNARFDVARQAREQEAARPDSSALEAARAAIQTWTTTKLIKRVFGPSFDNDIPIENPTAALDQIAIAADSDDREYLLENAKGVNQLAHAVRVIEDRNQARAVVGDHEIVGTATQFIDPIWLAVPAAFKVGNLAGVAGRTASAVAGAGIAGAATALGEGPVSDQEIALNMIMGGAVSAAFFKAGKVVPKDPDYPKDSVDAIVSDLRAGVAVNVERQSKVPTSWEDRNLIDEARANAPKADVDPLATGALNTDATKVVDAVEKAIATKDMGWGERFQWNMRKTMSSYGAIGKKVADLIFDNNSDLSINSLESHHAAILTGLRTHQFNYESQLRNAMAEDGFGTLKQAMPNTSRQAYDAQLKIERQVQLELFRREQSARTGVDIAADVPKRITAMADTLDAMHKQALQELKSAGVKGAEALEERAGYLNRKWSSQGIDNMLDRMRSLGLDDAKAMAKVRQLVSTAVRRGNGMDKDIANEISQAIITRAINKGYFEDTVFNSVSTEGTLREISEIMRSGGSSQPSIDRVMKALTAQSDEAGKAGFVKHRMDLDYKATVNIGNELFNITDLIDGRVTSIVDQYNRRVATTAAFARKGLKDASSIDALRSELSFGIKDAGERAKAVNLFDTTMAHFRGEPAGGVLNENFRTYQAFGRSIALAWSGLWQFTEYATMMGQYGVLKTLKYAVKNNPEFGKLMQDPASAKQLNTVLAEHSVQSLRLRPYLSRYEDGFEMDKTSALQLSMQTVGDIVPMANAMKYVHHHQAKLVGNLILDRLDMAAKGNTKARAMLEKYGIESPVMDKLAIEIEKHGYNVDAWDDAVWASTRPAFAKMMDTAVLKERLGDMPEFAKFDATGKVLFTYRSFSLIAHNKILAGTLQRDGAAALGMIMMYQFPLSMMAVQAKASIMGEGTLDSKELSKRTVGQMGGLGLFSEPMKWVTGESNSIGASALIPADRAIRLVQSGLNGEAGKTASIAATMLPVVSAIPFTRAVAEKLKEE